MTLLQMINGVQDSLSLPKSSAVISSTDPNVRRLLALANREGKELMRRYPWQALVTEKTFAATATETQADAIPTDMDRIVNESMFNRTQKRRVVGPLNTREWQVQKALTAQVIVDAFRIRGDALLIIPTPEAGDTYAFEYVSKNFCTDSGGTGQAKWAADNDVGALSEDLMELGITWRFLKSSNLDYAESFNTYEREVIQAMSRDGGKRTVNFATDDSLIDGARIPYVPEGSWGL